MDSTQVRWDDGIPVTLHYPTGLGLLPLCSRFRTIGPSLTLPFFRGSSSRFGSPGCGVCPFTCPQSLSLQALASPLLSLSELPSSAQVSCPGQTRSAQSTYPALGGAGILPGALVAAGNPLYVRAPGILPPLVTRARSSRPRPSPLFLALPLVARQHGGSPNPFPGGPSLRCGAHNGSQDPLPTGGPAWLLSELRLLYPRRHPCDTALGFPSSLASVTAWIPLP